MLALGVGRVGRLVDVCKAALLPVVTQDAHMTPPQVEQVFVPTRGRTARGAVFGSAFCAVMAGRVWESGGMCKEWRVECGNLPGLCEESHLAICSAIRSRVARPLRPPQRPLSNDIRVLCSRRT